MNYHEDHEKRALNALAADMGLHDGANRDAALGLPVVALGPDSTRKVDAYMKAHGFRDGEYSVSAFDVPHDGTKPGPTTPCRTEAASLSVAEATRKEHEAEAEHNACGVVESAAWDVLVGSGLTDEQHKLLSAYHTRVYRTRDAYIKLVHARAATTFAIRMNGGAQ